MTAVEQVRDRWFLWLLTEEIEQRPCVVAVAELYRRRIAGDEPTVKEWKTAAAASAAAYAAVYAVAAAVAADAAVYAVAAAAFAGDAAAAAAARAEIWRRMGAKLVELLGEQLPRFSNLHKVISDRITPANFDMAVWHCGTTHCRAGHAIDAAGQAGYALERVFGPRLTAAAIYLGNTGMLPDFHASNDEALDDIRRCAGAAS